MLLFGKYLKAFTALIVYSWSTGMLLFGMYLKAFTASIVVFLVYWDVLVWYVFESIYCFNCSILGLLGCSCLVSMHLLLRLWYSWSTGMLLSGMYLKALGCSCLVSIWMHLNCFNRSIVGLSNRMLLCGRLLKAFGTFFNLNQFLGLIFLKSFLIIRREFSRWWLVPWLFGDVKKRGEKHFELTGLP